MRFSHSTLPASEFIGTDLKVQQLCEFMSKYKEPYGFDTETDGLGFRNVYEVEKVTPAGKIQRSNKESVAGDGLGANLKVICLSFEGRRVAVPTYGEYRRFLDPMARVLRETQDQACGWNWIFDANVMESNVGRNDWELTSMFGDGFALMHHWDEDAEDTEMQRDLKTRARQYLGLPMNDFDRFLIKGIEGALRDPDTYEVALDYCTRDAFAHRGMMLRNVKIAQRLPWCRTCNVCGKPAMQRHFERDEYYCPDHGWVRGQDELTIWDWHRLKDVPFMVILKRMEQNGLLIDDAPLIAAVNPLRNHLQKLQQRFQNEISTALSEQGGLPWPVSPSSSKQLGKLYYGDFDARGAKVGFNLPIGRLGKTGNASTAIKNLQKLYVTHKAPGVQTLSEISKLSKILSTYVLGLSRVKWSKTRRLHTTMRPYAATGRLRSRNPNGQNLPRDPLFVKLDPTNAVAASMSVEEIAIMWGVPFEEAQQVIDADPAFKPRVVEINIRDAFVAEEGHVLVCADYEQLEVRLLAIESRDPILCQVINDGTDLHCYTASKSFGPAYKGMTYESLNETQQSKDGNYTYRIGRIVQYYIEGEQAWPDLAAALLQPTPASPLDKTEAARSALPAFAESFCTKLSELGVLEDIVIAGFRVTEDLAKQIEKSLGKALLKEMSSLLGVRDGLNKACRTAAKAVIFGCIYGIGALGLAVNISEQTGQHMTTEEAKALIDTVIYQEFKLVGETILRQKKAVEVHGYVRTAMGRYRTPAGSWSADFSRRARAARQANNSPIQGLAMDITREVMIAITNDPVMLRCKATLLMQVHDEILMQCRSEHAEEVCDRLQYLMANAHGLSTPVPLSATAHYAECWGKAK